MDIVPASKSSDWFKALDNATVNSIGGNNVKDGINGPKFGLIVDELNKAKTVADQINIWQKYLKDPTILTGKGLAAAKKAFNTWMTGGKLPANVQSVLSKDPLAALPELAQAQLTYDKTDPASVKNYATALKDTYGNLKKADGTPEFTPVYLDSVAAGTIPQDTFDTRINTIATKAAFADLKAQGINPADVGGAEGLASSDKLAEYLNDPTKLASAYTTTSTANSTVPSNVGTGSVSNAGIDSLGYTNGTFDYTGGSGQLLTDGKVDPTKVKAAVDAYDTQKGTWHLPDTGRSGLTQTDTTPFGSYLQNMLVNYANKGDFYSPSYVNNLKQPEAPNLTNIKTSFENNPTSKDLSSYLVKMHQPSTANTTGQTSKPGTPDTTTTKVPTVNAPAVNTPAVNTPAVNTPAVNTPAVSTPAVSTPAVSTPAVSTPAVSTPAVSTPAVSTPVKTAAEIAAEKAEADRLAEINRIAAEKAEAERQAGLVALANQQAADKAAADKAAADKAEADRLAALGRNPDGGPSSLAPINPNTYGPQQITLAPNTVALSNSPSVIAAQQSPAQKAAMAQTVTLPTVGPQPINPSNGGPTSAITVNPSNAGIVGTIDPATLSVANMNSNVGGLPSLMGPQQVTVQPQQNAGVGTVLAPAPTQTSAQNAATQQTPQNPWDKMGITQQDYYENYW